jgi:hypothetical protein
MPRGFKKDGTKNGGRRVGAGNKSKYSEETVKIAQFSCPISKVKEVNKMIKDKLAEYETQKVDNKSIESIKKDLG